MADINLNLAANQTSAPITVPARKLVGIESDKPITVKAKGGSVIYRTSSAKTGGLFVPPNETITIQAGPGGAAVIYNLDA